MAAGQASDPVEARIALMQAAKAFFAERNAELSAIAGYSVEFNICGKNRFMLSAQGYRAESLKALVDKMPGVTVVSSEYDGRNDCSRCFFVGRDIRNWPDCTGNRRNLFWREK